MLCVILGFIILLFFYGEKAFINYIIVLAKLLFGINESNPSWGFLDLELKHKPENKCYKSSQKSSTNEIPFKKRKERRRSNTSKAFFETLANDKSSTFSFTKDNGGEK